MESVRRVIGHRRGPLAGSVLIRIMDMSDMDLASLDKAHGHDLYAAAAG